MYKILKAETLAAKIHLMVVHARICVYGVYHAGSGDLFYGI